MSAQAPKKKGFGCLGYGCIVAVILMVVIIGGLFLVARSAMRNAVVNFTTDQSIPVPSVALDAAAKAAAETRLSDLARLWNDPHSSGMVSLTQGDIFGLLGDTPFNGLVFVELKGSEIASTFSFPLKALGEWEAAKPIIGDYLNRFVSGSATAQVSINDGVTEIKFTGLTLNGQVFDGDSLLEASEWVSGFANSGASSEEEKARRARIESVKVENGAVTVRLRAR